MREKESEKESERRVRKETSHAFSLKCSGRERGKELEMRLCFRTFLPDTFFPLSSFLSSVSHQWGRNVPISGMTNHLDTRRMVVNEGGGREDAGGKPRLSDAGTSHSSFSFWDVPPTLLSSTLLSSLLLFHSSIISSTLLSTI